MRITFLCSDPFHPVRTFLEQWKKKVINDHEVDIVSLRVEAEGGDFLFLVSASELVPSEIRAKYKYTLVLHASDLPLGRGWSPHIWELIAGSANIVVSLLEAADKVDSGKIWKKVKINIPKHLLWNEINCLLFQKEIELIDFAVQNFANIEPQEQDPEVSPTYYPRRVPEHSKIDPNRTLADQFDLIRVCDPNRFPAFFEFREHRYILRIERVHER